MLKTIQLTNRLVLKYVQGNYSPDVSIGKLARMRPPVVENECHNHALYKCVRHSIFMAEGRIQKFMNDRRNNLSGILR